MTLAAKSKLSAEVVPLQLREFRQAWVLRGRMRYVRQSFRKLAVLHGLTPKEWEV